MQTMTNKKSTSNPSDLVLHLDDLAAKTNQFSATDTGYEISLEDLGNAVTTNIADNSTVPTNLKVSPDEFEFIYQWFIA